MCFRIMHSTLLRQTQLQLSRDMLTLNRSVSTVWSEPDMSIWEVRGRRENFVYSKVMLWVAFDRALRLAEKRCLPCPARHQWLETRDNIYDQIMTKGYNKDLRLFAQSYESTEVLDAAVLIMPLVFFIGPNDPRFLRTLEQILKSPEKGGLTSAGLVFRYNHQKMDDGEILHRPQLPSSRLSGLGARSCRTLLLRCGPLPLNADRLHPLSPDEYKLTESSQESAAEKARSSCVPSGSSKLLLEQGSMTRHTSRGPSQCSKTCCRSAIISACSVKRSLFPASSWETHHRLSHILPL